MRQLKNTIQGYLLLNRLKGQVRHSKTSKMKSSLKYPTLIWQMGLRWTLESTVSSPKFLESHLSDKSAWMVGSKVYCSWICDTDPFSSLLCGRLRQSRAVWPGRQEPPIPSKCRMSHLEHSGKDFNTPSLPSAPHPPPPPLFLITHYPIPVLGREFHKHFQATWTHVNSELTAEL